MNETKPKTSTAGVILALIFFILIAVFIGRACACVETPISSSTPKGPSEVDAYGMAQHFVKDYLKAPGTARFPTMGWDSGISVISLGLNEWNVRAWVDAENSFGALIRNNFTCTLKYVGNDNWQLEKLTLGDQVFK